MTASNAAPEGMANTRDSALLSAAAEAVSWNHASQPDEPRKGQRVIIYPKDLPQLDEFLATRDPNVDPEDWHPMAYEVILRDSAKYETTPLFLREDSNPVTSDPILAAKVPEWLAISRQVATGNRRRVLENGIDQTDSSDEYDMRGSIYGRDGPEGGPQSLDPDRGRLPESGRESNEGTSTASTGKSAYAIGIPSEFGRRMDARGSA
jgi:hypothetical protein